jgi:hypothetical protein
MFLVTWVTQRMWSSTSVPGITWRRYVWGLMLWLSAYEPTICSLGPRQRNIMKQKWNIYVPILKLYKTQYRRNRRIWTTSLTWCKLSYSSLSHSPPPRAEPPSWGKIISAHTHFPLWSPFLSQDLYSYSFHMDNIASSSYMKFYISSAEHEGRFRQMASEAWFSHSFSSCSRCW